MISNNNSRQYKAFYSVVFLSFFLIFEGCLSREGSNLSLSKNHSTGMHTSDSTSIIPDIHGVLELRAALGRAFGPKIEYLEENEAYGWWTSKDTVIWEVEVHEAGNYQIEMEWSVADNEAEKEVILDFMLEKIITRIPSSNSWEIFKIEKIGTVVLEAGRQQVKVYPKNIDQEGYYMDLRALKLIKEKN